MHGDMTVGNFWAPIKPLVLGELVTVAIEEEFFFGRSRVLVRPGDVMIITRMSDDGVVTALLHDEREVYPHHIDHPTFVRLS